MICTPFGFRKISDLSIGSLVSNPDGSAAQVVKITPLGKQDIYKVSFMDGASTLVTLDHLWIAHIVGIKTKADQRHVPFDEDDAIGNWKVYTTEQLIDRLRRAKKSKSVTRPNILIPLTEPVPFTLALRGESPWDVIPPYVLGLVLGDGSSNGSSLQWCKPDDILVEFVQQETGKKVSTGRDGKNRRILDSPEYAAAYERMGLMGKLSPEKFIPERFLHAPLDIRWALVQGLMDTDGTVDDRGHPSFTSTSKPLAESLQYILRSLGFKVTLTSGPAGYKNEDGDYVKCHDAHTLYIRGKYAPKLFRLPRKLARLRPYNGGSGEGEVNRRLVSIEKVGQEEAACISVSNPNSLYLTDDFIVTHNSFTEILFFTKGNPHLKPRSLVDTSYIYHPYYFAVVIRKDQIDLDNWVREAHRVYSLLGARWVGRPEAKFVFPHPKNPKLEGATIRTGHLQDASSYQKYIGKNIHRLGIEELIQIPDENAFLELRLSVRSQFPEIIPQILTTFNPIGGPGVAWVFHRYIEPKHRRKDGTLEPLLDSTGAPIKAYEPDWTPKYPEPIVEEEIGEEVFHRLGIPVPPLAERKRSRVFIPARVTDNPHLGADYILTLASDPDENRARAYLHGEWSLVGGSYLSHARFDGPLKNEPPNACHSIFRSPIDPDTHQPSELRRLHLAPEILPWWYRHMGGDWGFEHEAAFYWGATHPRTQQLVIYRERVFSHTYPEHVGVEIAQESLPELTAPGSSHSIILWIGRDVSQNRMGADRTVIEMLTRGMKRVLGNDGVHVPELLIREMEDEAYAQSRPLDPEALETFKNLKRSGITVRWARPQNKSGWEICRALFRWTPAVPVEGFDKDLAFKILSEDGMTRYQEYVAHCSKREVEALPVLQVVYEACPRLIDALPKLQKGDAAKGHDPDMPNYKIHFLGMDECAAFYYLVQGWREDRHQEEPLQHYVERRMLELTQAVESQPSTTPAYSVMDLIRIRNGFEAEHRAKLAPTIIHPRHLSAQRGIAARREVAKLLGGGGERG